MGESPALNIPLTEIISVDEPIDALDRAL